MNKSDYIDNEEFRNFVNMEFNSAAYNSTVEDLAGFAFGSVDEAIKAFKKEE